MINKNNFKKINELLDSIFNELAEIKQLLIEDFGNEEEHDNTNSEIKHNREK